MNINAFKVLGEEFSELAQWLKPLCRYNKKFEDFIVADYKKKSLNLKLFTKDHEYSISVRLPDNDDNIGYLGCISKTRKPRAGEDWNRGNDLPDGAYCEEIWQSILSGILAYELVKVVKPQKQDVFLKMSSKKQTN